MPQETTANTSPPHVNPYAGRDRVLLYTRGMNIPPVEGVALALESLQRAGEDAQPDTVMEELYALLHEKTLVPYLSTYDGTPLVSAPPMNRRNMIAEDMDQFSITKTLVRVLRERWLALVQKIRRNR